ncbi:MAG: iron-containing alcohol dehydrogenase [Clostridia bacterium]|nr:iron-containing alcohol dehydrogenase [Clostridia bacterium]
MSFNFYLPTRIVFGEGAIKSQAERIAQLGRRALVVTGRNSAIISGAMADFEALAKKHGLSWVVFNDVPANPELNTVASAVNLARKEKVDFVVGIGGGSPLDTAKAVALLATNNIPAAELYEHQLPKAPLPLVAVPTTAGTGSEVTQYAVFTLPHRGTKKGFGDERCFPNLAVVDPVYTYSLPWEVTIDTALDALTHAVEGYLSKRSTPLSDTLALEAVAIFAGEKEALVDGELGPRLRRQLMYAATLAGIVIAQTRTTLLHTLGYQLTFNYNIPHGRANGYLLAAYLEFVRPARPEKVDKILAALGMASITEVKDLMQKLLPPPGSYSQAEIEQMAALVAANPGINIVTAREATKQDLLKMLQRSLA